IRSTEIGMAAALDEAAELAHRHPATIGAPHHPDITANTNDPANTSSPDAPDTSPSASAPTTGPPSPESSAPTTGSSPAIHGPGGHSTHPSGPATGPGGAGGSHTPSAPSTGDGKTPEAPSGPAPEFTDGKGDDSVPAPPASTEDRPGPTPNGETASAEAPTSPAPDGGQAEPPARETPSGETGQDEGTAPPHSAEATTPETDQTPEAQQAPETVDSAEAAGQARIEELAADIREGAAPPPNSLGVEALREALDAPELKGTNKIPAKSNAAIMRADIEGMEVQTEAASSGTKEKNNGLVKFKENPIFEAEGGVKSRRYDSEVKLLEELASRLSGDARGDIEIYTERPPCRSCRGVMEQFRERYPDVQLKVTWGEKNIVALDTKQRYEDPNTYKYDSSDPLDKGWIIERLPKSAREHDMKIWKKNR
ncbi:deaminase domain-containing protein, partial [Salinactinospora qingdaonensis]|uniref:deaminase domain-containing protein n=1 Tax=Salinactinospora qingdaonensis TaxID=702744 RepID=UPI0031EC8272